jgi:biotin carboxyl carrier protein
MEERWMIAKLPERPAASGSSSASPSVSNDETLLLLSPAVGLFTGAARQGDVLCERQRAGTLLVLGRACALIVPDGVEGRVRNQRPERVHEPVDYGRVLYELAPLEGASAAAPTRSIQEEAQRSQGLFVLAPQTGRFYHRARPGDPPFVQPGSRVQEGSALGLIEVMKTFSQVAYHVQGGRSERLPAQARVVAHLVADGAEVAQGTPLIEVVPWGSG